MSLFKTFQTLERQHSACQLKTMLANQAAKLELKVSIKDIINEIVEVALVSGVDLVIGGEFMETLVSPSEEHLPKISDLRKDIHGKKNCSVDHEFRSWFERYWYVPGTPNYSTISAFATHIPVRRLMRVPLGPIKEFPRIMSRKTSSSLNTRQSAVNLLP